MKEEKSGRRKKLIWLIIALIVAVIIVLAAFQNNMTNALNDSLIKSLSTLKIDSVTYPSVEPESITMNITFVIKNPTDYAITVAEVFFSFSVNETAVGTEASIVADQYLPAKGNGSFSVEYDVTDAFILSCLREQAYVLKVEGNIKASANYLFVQTSRTRIVAFTETHDGVP